MQVATLLVNLISTLIVLGAFYFVYLSTKSDKAKSALNVLLSLPQLAEQAVVWAEKNGVTQDGKAQFDQAVAKVKDDLAKVGVDAPKQAQIEDAVEHAWAILKSKGTIDLYK